MHQWTIQNRILFLALLPGILVAFSLGSFFIIDRSQELDNLLENRALLMAKQLATTCEYGVMTGNVGILQNIATHMLDEKDVRSVTIYNQDMSMLTHAGPKMLTSRKTGHELHKNEQLFLLSTNDSVRVRAPIYAQNLVISDQLSDSFFVVTDETLTLLGWAELELTKTNTRLLRYQNIAAVLTVVFIALLICSWIAIRASRTMTVPLRHIMKTVKSLEDGKLDYRVHIHTGGELGLLASGINAMASALQRATTSNQEQIDQATRDLQETLDEMEIRNRELQLGRKEAQDANLVKSEFLANVSHEIRTPLNGIIGFIELLSRTQISERQTDYLATIQKSSNDLLKILNDILDFSKIDAGKLSIESTEMNLRDALEDVLAILAPAAVQKGLELNSLVYNDVPTQIKSDPLRLKQILTNLIGNAIKFTERGNVSVRVSVIRQDDKNARIQFEIQDTGIGMSDEQLNKIFMAFSQADNSIARQFGGTGLGLIISRALVEAMNGEILVSSQKDRGSVFSFHVDVGLQKDAYNDLPPIFGYRVALADTSLMNRMNTGNLLDQWEVAHDDFETYQNLLDKVEQYKDSPWNAFIIATNQMHSHDPQLNRLIDSILWLQIPIIIITDLSISNDIENFKLLGTEHILSHPYARRNLHRTLSLSLKDPDLLEEYDAQKSESLKATENYVPKILVVDDNPINLELINILLEEAGLIVLAAHSGQEAIDLVHQQDVDLIFMDIQMPNMGGVEASKHIRAIPNKSAIPIVALTAHAMSDEKEALLKAGLNGYQTKPISSEQLIACVERFTGYICNIEHQKIKPNASTSHFMRDIFDARTALRSANYNPTVSIEMFRMLLDAVPDDMQNILNAWEEENLSELLELVHRLHGASHYCGVPALQITLEHFETALKTHATHELPNHMRLLTEEVSKLQHWASTNDWKNTLISFHKMN